MFMFVFVCNWIIKEMFNGLRHGGKIGNGTRMI